MFVLIPVTLTFASIRLDRAAPSSADKSTRTLIPPESRWAIVNSDPGPGQSATVLTIPSTLTRKQSYSGP